MPADEVIHGTDVDESRVRSGPRHAAPRKPLFTRFHMPAGKAIALAAMPTAVLMGMGLTPTLASADDHSSSKSLTADEYKDCVAAVTGSDASASASATPSPSASTSSSTDKSTDKSTDDSKDEPSPSASKSSDASDTDTSSSDSGSDDKAEPTPTPSATAGKSTSTSSDSTATPSASASDDNVLKDIGDAITGIFTGGDDSSSSSTASPSASPSPSASATKDSSDSAGSSTSASDTVKDTTDKVTDTVKGATEKTEKTVEDTTKKATDTAEAAAEKAKDAAASATPSPSASSTTNPDDCPVATDDVGGVDNPVTLPDDPWYLNASSLLLKGADYQGIVKVRTANGSVKKVLKYVISDGTDIGDLHQTVKDKQSGKTYHVQAAAGSTSTIRNGKTVMYTESISGNLLGLIPVTFSPDSPPPLNIPLIYFTKVKVVQAGQFGGDLSIPGLHSYQD
ncbi:hypothetical protein [Streptomyces sp. SAS_270]|uniref:hypothetical protein n=1 Tax=Streptomyces sp. SAS_270 TaxID=3412748 RepID=UPI00403C7B80